MVVEVDKKIIAAAAAVEMAEILVYIMAME